MKKKATSKKQLTKRKAAPKPTAMDFEDDSEVIVTNEQLSEISQLAERQVYLEDVIARISDKLAKATKALNDISQKALPEALEAIGLKEITLQTGETIKVGEKLYASISQKNKPEAIKWLVQHKQQSLVKATVFLPFDKGDVKEARAAMALLRKGGYKPAMDNNVNTTQVKAVIQEMLQQGVNVPLELFGAHFARQSVVVLGKGKKAT